MSAKKFSHFYLKNGIEVVVYPIKEVRSIAVQFGMPFGSASEERSEAGTLHFLEHLLLEGSKKYPTPRDLNLRAEELGIDYNAFVGTADAYFPFFLPDINFKEGVEFIADIIMHPLFKQEEIEKNRSVILTEIKDRWDLPESKFYADAWAKRAGETHPYTRRGFGYPDVVKRMTKDKLIACYHKYYSPANFVLAIAGNVSPIKARGILEKTLGQWTSTNNGKKPFVPPRPKNKSTYFVFAQPRDQARFGLYFPTRGMKEYTLQERIIYGIVNFLLGVSRTSALYDRLRIDLGFVYSIDSRRVAFPYSYGSLVIEGVTNADRIEKVLDEVYKILVKVKSDGFAKRDFSRAISYMNAQSLISFSDPRNIADGFLSMMLDKYELVLPEDLVKIANTVTLEEVNSFAERILDFETSGLALMGDENAIKKSRVQEKFNKFIATI